MKLNNLIALAAVGLGVYLLTKRSNPTVATTPLNMALPASFTTMLSTATERKKPNLPPYLGPIQPMVFGMTFNQPGMAYYK